MKLSPSIVSLLILNAVAVQASPLPRIKASELLYPNQIRVRLAEASAKVEVRGTALRISYGAGRTLASIGEAEGEGWEVHCQQGRIRATQMNGGKTLELQEPVTVQSSSGLIQLENRTYRETLEIHSVGSLCEVVNQVELEKYLLGLVNAEFNSKWNEDSIEAQIIAARTYALYQMKIARGDPERRYDVDATVRDQVYDGTLREDQKAAQLVERTRGIVLTTGPANHSVPLKAFYHSTCGGMTELPQHVWGSAIPGFTRAVRCPYCSSSPALRWQLDLHPDEIAQAFKRGLFADESAIREANHRWPKGWQKVLKQGKLSELRAGRWDPEGRISEVVTTWKSPSSYAPVELRVTGARFRDWIGPARFRSANFEVIAVSSLKDGAARSWRFEGRGNGHGVGMCQWGAKTMGERGFRSWAILKHYYPDAVLRKLW